MKKNLIDTLGKYLGLERLNKKLDSSETEFLPAVIEVLETPPSPVGRMVLWTMFALLIAGIIWSIFGKVDEVVVAQGKLVPIGYVKTVQAEDKGIVTAVHIKDGQFVRKGEVLIELNQTYSQADIDKLQKDYAYNKVLVERLTAELNNQPFVPTEGQYTDRSILSVHSHLYESREEDIRARTAAAQAKIDSAKANLKVAEENKAKYEKLFQIAQDKMERIQKLYDENAIAYFVLLQNQEQLVSTQQTLAAQNAEISGARQTVAQAEGDLAAINAEQNNDINEKIVKARYELESIEESLKKAERVKESSVIVAPIDGYVAQLAVYSTGAVVSAAQPLMTIVPDDAMLEAEVWVDNKDIGFIREGQSAEIKVMTFNFQKYGVIESEVEFISPDAIERNKQQGKESSGDLSYRALLKIKKDYVVVGDTKVYLTSGMGVSAEIKTKQKSIIEFFLDPFRKYQSEALRER